VFNSRLEIKKAYEEKPRGKPEEYDNVEESLSRHFRIRYIVNLTTEKDIILDLGSGQGYVGKCLEKELNTYIALDISSKALKTGKKLLPRQHFILTDITQLPIKDEIADLVICSEVLEHIPKYDKLLNMIYKSLKKNGCTIITTPNYYNPDIFLRLILKGKSTKQIYNRPIPYKIIINKLRKKNFNIELLDFFYYHLSNLLPLFPIINRKIHLIMLKTSNLFHIPTGLYMILKARKLG